MQAGTTTTPPIVCGVDGSDESRRALHEAATLARALDTGLDVVMAWQHSTSMYDAYFPAPEQSPKVVAYSTLQELVAAEFGPTIPDWVRLRAESGHPGSVLVKAARDAAMLVVGSRGLSGLASPFLGSVSLYCATQAPCPVLVVRPPMGEAHARH
ncbi:MULTISPECIES: universal stress protein [unclassified Leifsonia]|uniref:universal stress protein n=1 Tax=unclassified Leifsonia TaxID=2663824 RepID=UPI0003640680|nr:MULTISPECIES: universal stress protein [unclassified Leifsonia]TDP98935.1 nucleotide-binding universal stress UspA family protein [Leifsonia sp. 115AMFTsu3.1]